MLDITTNQASTNSISNAAYCGYDFADEAAAAADLLLDEDLMDPLFEEDWLHENNLDILFDLFEEEIENKADVETNSHHHHHHHTSSTLFGTSPVTSYLFGTSPTLASALDLIYFDSQQPSISNNNEASSISLASPTPIAATTTSLATTMSASNTIATVPATTSIVASAMPAATSMSCNIMTATTPTSSTITNAMRIKRGFKKGQSEGVSLLAKPCLGNTGKTNGNISFNNNKNNSRTNNRRVNNSTTSKNISDKTSASNKNIIVNNRNGTDISYSKQSQQQSRAKYYLHKCQQHVHYITGRAVIHEHAYAVRGH